MKIQHYRYLTRFSSNELYLNLPNECFKDINILLSKLDKGNRISLVKLDNGKYMLKSLTYITDINEKASRSVETLTKLFDNLEYSKMEEIFKLMIHVGFAKSLDDIYNKYAKCKENIVYFILNRIIEIFSVKYQYDKNVKYLYGPKLKIATARRESNGDQFINILNIDFKDGYPGSGLRSSYNISNTRFKKCRGLTNYVKWN